MNSEYNMILITSDALEALQALIPCYEERGKTFDDIINDLIIASQQHLQCDGEIKEFNAGGDQS